MVKSTHIEFIEKLLISNIHYKNEAIKIVGKYNGLSNKILVEDSYGICAMFPANLLKGAMSSLKCAVDKTKYFISMIEESIEQEIDFSKTTYVNATTKVIISTKYGDCLINPMKLKSRKRISPRNAIDKEEYATNVLKDIWDNMYTYNIEEYINCYSKIKVFCKKHGQFICSYNNHAKGRGCPACGREAIAEHNSKNPIGWNRSNWDKASKESKYFTGFKVYLVKMSNENEEFYKIGRTFRSIRNRFKSTPYKIEKIYVKEFPSAHIAFNKELEVKKVIKNKKYIPNKNFDGMQECFIFDRNDCSGYVNLIKDILKTIQ